MADYVKTKTGGINIAKLHREITDDVGIAPTLIGVAEASQGSDDFTVIFTSALSAGEETTLDAVITAHNKAPLIGRLGDVVSAYDSTGGRDFTGSTTLGFDATQTNSNTSLYSLASSEVTIAETAAYQFQIDVSIGQVTTTARTSSRFWLECDEGSGYVEVSGTRAFGYHRQATEDENTGSIVTAIAVNAGDKFRVRAMIESGTGTLRTLAGGSRITVTRLD